MANHTYTYDTGNLAEDTDTMTRLYDETLRLVSANRPVAELRRQRLAPKAAITKSKTVGNTSKGLQ